MELIIDFMLLAASGAAVFYCVVLSRKLESLKNTENGLGASIATMSQTVDQARATVILAKESSSQSVRELTPLIEEMRVIMPKVTEMIDVLAELGEIAQKNINSAAADASENIEQSLSNARTIQSEIADRIAELNDLLNNTEAGSAAKAEATPGDAEAKAAAEDEVDVEIDAGAETEDETQPDIQPQPKPKPAPGGEVAYVDDFEPLNRRMVSSSANAISSEIDAEEEEEEQAEATG